MKKRNLEDYTPELLAKDYTNVAVLMTVAAITTKGTAKVVEQFANEILSYYKQHNTLKGFTVPGKIGPKVTEILEFIFQYGVSGARKIYRKRKDAAFKNMPKYWRGGIPHGKKDGNPPPSWDNAIRTIEDN